MGQRFFWVLLVSLIIGITGTLQGQAQQGTGHLLKAWLDCGTFLYLMGGEASKSCDVNVSDWLLTEDRVQVVFEQLDMQGSLPGGIEVSPGNTTAFPSSMQQQTFHFSEVFAARATAPPSIQQFTIIVSQHGAQDVRLQLEVQVFAAVPPVSIEQALDVNHNDRIDDSEILTAVSLWVHGTTVPGTGSQTINDQEILKLIALWATGDPISSARLSEATSPSGTARLVVRGIGIELLGVGKMRLVAHGQGIVGLEAQIFDLSGRVVLHQTTSGTTLTFRALAANGQPLANGVYLYVVTVKGFEGTVLRSDVKKLAIWR